jgi:hypothetical protein
MVINNIFQNVLTVGNIDAPNCLKFDLWDPIHLKIVERHGNQAEYYCRQHDNRKAVNSYRQ